MVSLTPKMTKGDTYVELLSRERPTANTRRIRFDHPNRLPNQLRRDTQPRAHPNNRRRARRHERVRAEVDIQHQRVRALDQHMLPA